MTKAINNPVAGPRCVLTIEELRKAGWIVIGPGESDPRDAEIERLTNLTDQLRMEAQLHSGEARAANASLREAYQAVSGGRGEPGSWNGAEPIKAEVSRLRAKLAEVAEGRLAEAEGVIEIIAGKRQHIDSLMSNQEIADAYLRAARKFMEQSR
ncbi:hypothetical protein [Nitratireductor soli]|uniref:hypothetical protein n=1 Tax=Nitratireductor soli TaxID=1670619 RepID=UPI00065E6E85|nr:hypothetical protein [Nitratireductor soli]